MAGAEPKPCGWQGGPWGWPRATEVLGGETKHLYLPCWAPTLPSHCPTCRGNSCGCPGPRLDVSQGGQAVSTEVTAISA